MRLHGYGTTNSTHRARLGKKFAPQPQLVCGSLIEVSSIAKLRFITAQRALPPILPQSQHSVHKQIIIKKTIHLAGAGKRMGKLIE